MAKFIKLTDMKRGNIFALNIETIEYMLPNTEGTALVSVTHHTKYDVKESMDDILALLDGPIAVG
jgi:uncharacterized protein YlzI (FlbEa/FlbD family)